MIFKEMSARARRGFFSTDFIRIIERPIRVPQFRAVVRKSRGQWDISRRAICARESYQPRGIREKEKEKPRRQPQWRSSLRQSVAPAAKPLIFCNLRDAQRQIFSNILESRPRVAVQELLTHSNYSSLWHLWRTCHSPVLDIMEDWRRKIRAFNAAVVAYE